MFQFRIAFAYVRAKPEFAHKTFDGATIAFQIRTTPATTFLFAFMPDSVHFANAIHVFTGIGLLDEPIGFIIKKIIKLV
jgi:hypothetical protein